MSWTLEYNNVERPLAEWGLGRLRRARMSQRADVVTVRHDGADMTSAPLFASESAIVLRRDGALWFRGVVTRLPVAGAPQGETQDYEFSGPWWHLENLVYQQFWQQAANPGDAHSGLHAVAKGRVVLGQADSGAALSAADQATAIVNYAIAAGAPLQLGECSLNSPMPLDEARDLSCAEALRRVLRWTPDAVTWLDYSTSPKPTLHLARRGALASRALALPDLQRLEIAPRHDLVRTSVVIKYEKTHVEDGFQWSTTETDAAPSGADGTDLKALVLTTPLRGLHASYVKQDVTAATIDSTSAAWWRDHHPALRGLAVEDITVANPARDGTLPRELVSGGVAPWMGCAAAPDVVSADISYATENESVTRRMAVRLMATDAINMTYFQLASYTPEEIAPTGLAASLLAAVGTLHYEGVAEWIAPEAADTPWLGARLEVSAGQSAWAAMHALVQEVEEHVDEGLTRIHFGPPRQLGASDWETLLKANRRREPSPSAPVRGTGKPTATAEIEHGVHHRLENTTAGPAAYKRLKLADPENPDRAIILDTGAMSRALTVQLRELEVCVDGVSKRVLALCSETYDP